MNYIIRNYLLQITQGTFCFGEGKRSVPYNHTGQVTNLSTLLSGSWGEQVYNETNLCIVSESVRLTNSSVLEGSFNPEESIEWTVKQPYEINMSSKTI
jgi:hypothetical protein